MRAGMIRGAALWAALAAASGSPASSARADPAPDARYRAMVDRPLFAPTRRPPPPALPPLEPPVMAVPGPSRPDVELSGVIAGGGGGIALVRRPQDGAPVRLALSGEIDGWTLVEIRPRAIVLRRDGRDVTVDLPKP